MAGDWIKMRQDLGDDPAVILISAKTGLCEDTVVGKLHKLWCWADKHTTEGKAQAITSSWVDRFIGHAGFADAMVLAGWLDFSDDGIIFPDFDRHNGKSAKTRCENSNRQRLSRENRDKSVTKPLPEKRREEKNNKPLSSGDDEQAKNQPDYQAIIELYNKVLPNLPSVKLLTDKRKASIRSCCQLKSSYYGLDFWEAYFEQVNGMDFLMGRKTDWKADFDFLITKSKFVKVLEGSYE